jgi:hypothetical protein
MKTPSRPKQQVRKFKIKKIENPWPQHRRPHNKRGGKKDDRGQQEPLCSSSPLVTLGDLEVVSLPDVGLAAVEALVDTGADITHLAADEVRVLPPLRGGKKSAQSSAVAFRIGQRWHYAFLEGHGRFLDGAPTVRVLPVIRTTVRVGEVSAVTKVALNPNLQGLRMLLGREFLRGRCSVSPGLDHLQGRMLCFHQHDLRFE